MEINYVIHHFYLDKFVPIIIKPYNEVIISPDSLICFTDNLDIDGQFKIKSIIVSEGVRKTKLTNNSNEIGMVWLNSYGGYIYIYFIKIYYNYVILYF